MGKLDIRLFVTGRVYDYIQVLAFVAVDGGVIFEDPSRGIGGFLKGCKLEGEAVLRAYDRGGYRLCSYECVDQLTEAAKKEAARLAVAKRKF